MLYQMQGFKRRCTKLKIAGVQLKCLLELHQYLLPYKMPETLSALMTRTVEDAPMASDLTSMVFTSGSTGRSMMIYIPLPDTYGVEGAVLTGRNQVQHIGQLV